jgi:hypothetical protein
VRSALLTQQLSAPVCSGTPSCFVALLLGHALAPCIVCARLVARRGEHFKSVRPSRRPFPLPVKR